MDKSSVYILFTPLDQSQAALIGYEASLLPGLAVGVNALPSPDLQIRMIRIPHCDCRRSLHHAGKQCGFFIDWYFVVSAVTFACSQAGNDQQRYGHTLSSFYSCGTKGKNLVSSILSPGYIECNKNQQVAHLYNCKKSWTRWLMRLASPRANHSTESSRLSQVS